MHVDEPAARELLARMVRSLTNNEALWDDLHQEALIHLWIIEARRPGQTRSWYLQSCKFHMLHYLAAGRSVDSFKRRDGQRSYESESDDQLERNELIEPESVLSCVSARDLVTLLSPQLLPNERAVLDCLADGLGPREIGRRLNISHTMVIKHRCKIASLFNRLEIFHRQINGNGHTNGHGRANGNGHKQAVAGDRFKDATTVSFESTWPVKLARNGKSAAPAPSVYLVARR